MRSAICSNAEVTPGVLPDRSSMLDSKYPPSFSAGQLLLQGKTVVEAEKMSGTFKSRRQWGPGLLQWFSCFNNI